MIITYLGQSCFKFQTRDLTLITDPYGPEAGGSGARSKADIVTISHNHADHNYLKGISGDPFVIDSAGEYEVKGIYIVGLPSFHDNRLGEERGKNIIYRYVIEGMVLAHLGDLGHLLSSESVDRLGDVDVLFAPVGGVYTLNVDKIPELVSQIEPRLLIPMHYALAGSASPLKPLDNFCEEMGVKDLAPQDKLKLRKQDLASEDTEIKILKKQ